MNYGQGYRSLAADLGVSSAHAKKLMRDHREVYPDLWRWLSKMQDDAAWNLQAHAINGWRIRIDDRVGHRTLDNFFAQANGAEMLRQACVMIGEVGVEVVLPVHDAVLIEASDAEIDDLAKLTAQTMSDVSEAMTGLRLRTDVKIYRDGERILDPEGQGMWDRVMRELERC
jgi:DNA polymerase I-like protein with 3'-5' exonuclease and polymerase domains